MSQTSCYPIFFSLVNFLCYSISVSVPAPCYRRPGHSGYSYFSSCCFTSAIKVPGEINRSRGGRCSWTFKLAQKRSCVGRWSWAAKVGLLSLRVVRQQQCNGHCLCNSAQAQQLKQQLRSALVAGQWRGDTALTLPLFWRRSTAVSGLFRAVSAVEPSLLRPLPPLSPSLINNLASVDVKQTGPRPQKPHTAFLGIRFR